jgi:hypothetical protein
MDEITKRSYNMEHRAQIIAFMRDNNIHIDELIEVSRESGFVTYKPEFNVDSYVQFIESTIPKKVLYGKFGKTDQADHNNVYWQSTIKTMAEAPVDKTIHQLDEGVIENMLVIYDNPLEYGRLGRESHDDDMGYDMHEALIGNWDLLDREFGEKK